MTPHQTEARLLQLGFSRADLQRCGDNGWTPSDVLMRVENLLAVGLTTENYARETFFEAEPDLLSDVPSDDCINPPRRYEAKQAAEFGEDTTSFIWYPYIPIGDYTVIMSSGGTGKTYFVCGVAAGISNGANLPGDFTLKRSAQNVLIISAEDRGELLKKRLNASGADLKKVYILDCRDSEGLNFTDRIDEFKNVIAQYDPALVIIDPWHAFLGEDIDINRVNAVRPCFQRLANVAKDANCGMILVSHVNKRQQGENLNNAATGSTDFVNAARSALYVIFDEDDPDGRIVVHSKTNYAPYGRSLKYHINENGGLEWAGFSDIDRSTMEEAARQRKTPGEISKRNDARSADNAALVSALMDAANPFSVVRFSYENFKAVYGAGIFGSVQPKRALDAVADIMSGCGYQIQTGIQVKKDGQKGNGFAIASFEADNY